MKPAQFLQKRGILFKILIILCKIMTKKVQTYHPENTYQGFRH